MGIAKAISPLITLSNGRTVPLLGLGTWKSKPGEVYNAVKYAITEAGYRHIDCAFVYGNQEEVGRAINEVLESGALKREDLFITSKIWNTSHSKARVAENLAATLAQLKLDYLDLLLIHWPFGYQEGGEIFPKDDKDNVLTSDVDYLETWSGLEEGYEAGLVKSIGVSNFNSEQIKRIIDNAKVKPVMNQVECHPYLNQSELIAFCRANGVQLTAYSPLGSPDRPWAKAGDPLLLEEPAVVAIAKKYNKEPAQVLIRFQVQRKAIVIPKSVTPARIASNIQVFDFELTADEVKTIEGFNRGHRFLELAHIKGHKYYPFHIPY